jgi:hypothetical protein
MLLARCLWRAVNAWAPAALRFPIFLFYLLYNSKEHFIIMSKRARSPKHPFLATCTCKLSWENSGGNVGASLSPKILWDSSFFVFFLSFFLSSWGARDWNIEDGAMREKKKKNCLSITYPILESRIDVSGWNAMVRVSKAWSVITHGFHRDSRGFDSSRKKPPGRLPWEHCSGCWPYVAEGVTNASLSSLC